MEMTQEQFIVFDRVQNAIGWGAQVYNLLVTIKNENQDADRLLDSAPYAVREAVADLQRIDELIHKYAQMQVPVTPAKEA